MASIEKAMEPVASAGRMRPVKRTGAPKRRELEVVR